MHPGRRGSRGGWWRWWSSGWLCRASGGPDSSSSHWSAGRGERASEGGWSYHLTATTATEFGLSYHFDVEEQQQLEDLHGRQQRAEEDADPAWTHSRWSVEGRGEASCSCEHSVPGQRLCVDQVQNIPGDIERRIPAPPQHVPRKQPAGGRETWWSPLVMFRSGHVTRNRGWCFYKPMSQKQPPLINGSSDMC